MNIIYEKVCLLLINEDKNLKNVDFNNKTVLVTGGTGSFGNAVFERMINSNVAEIRVFSRDEKKQDAARRKYNNNKLKFYIGDVRDFNSISNATKGVDYVFHAAALKQVPSCEFHPLEAVKTNILGTENVLEAAISSKVRRVVCLSTDKAVYPINAMGMSKALMEKVAVAKSRTSDETTICVTRYGNVMGSRGSVIPLFIEQILRSRPVTVTDLEMTRFMMTLDDAVNLVLYAFMHGNSGEIFVQKAPAATLKVLVKALFKIFNVSDHKINVIGTRHGEKLYESLLSREEMALATDLEKYYCLAPDMRSLNYEKFMDMGQQSISSAVEYNSHNTTRLSVSDMQKMLMKLPIIQQSLSNSDDYTVKQT